MFEIKFLSYVYCLVIQNRCGWVGFKNLFFNRRRDRCHWYCWYLLRDLKIYKSWDVRDRVAKNTNVIIYENIVISSVEPSVFHRKKILRKRRTSPFFWLFSSSSSSLRLYFFKFLRLRLLFAIFSIFTFSSEFFGSSSLFLREFFAIPLPHFFAISSPSVDTFLTLL